MLIVILPIGKRCRIGLSEGQIPRRYQWGLPGKQRDRMSWGTCQSTHCNGVFLLGGVGRIQTEAGDVKISIGAEGLKTKLWVRRIGLMVPIRPVCHQWQRAIAKGSLSTIQSVPTVPIRYRKDLCDP
jgi:hypothetical protein